MKKRQRLKRGDTSRKRDRLTKVQQFESEIGNPPTMVKSSETSPIISVSTAYHKPFSDKGFENMVAIIKEKGATVEKGTGEVSLHVEGNSPLVSYFKKNGIKAGDRFVINEVGSAAKSNTGYDIEFYSANNNPEVYGLAVKLLAYMGVPANAKVKSGVSAGAIKETVAGKEIVVDFDRHELNMENIREMSDKMQVAGRQVSEAVGENWFPCGFVSINLDKKSPLVPFFKKYGKPVSNWGYEIEGFGTLSFTGSPSLSLKCIPSGTATECQSLNYNEPVYRIASKMLERMGVKNYVDSMVD